MVTQFSSTKEAPLTFTVTLNESLNIPFYDIIDSICFVVYDGSEFSKLAENNSVSMAENRSFQIELSNDNMNDIRFGF